MPARFCSSCGAAVNPGAQFCAACGARVEEPLSAVQHVVPGPAYVEFRIGDYQAELGIIDRRWAPPGASAEPGGVLMNWHVDDIEATMARLLAMGAKEYQPITPRGEGFVNAAVIDPFGNVLGIMYNPHYLEILAGRPQA